jgi:glucose dehydrogenase
VNVPDNLFVYGNTIEAAFWIVVGLGFVVRALLAPPAVQTRLWLAALLLITFGISDLVEVRTGAWWKPWWLLVWKGTCVVGLLTLLVGYIRTRRATPESASASDEPGPDDQA